MDETLDLESPGVVSRVLELKAHIHIILYELGIPMRPGEKAERGAYLLTLYPTRDGRTPVPRGRLEANRDLQDYPDGP